MSAIAFSDRGSVSVMVCDRFRKYVATSAACSIRLSCDGNA